MYQPMYQPYQPTWTGQQLVQQYQQPVNGLVSVTGIEGARAYQLPPNSSMPLFDANEDVFYVKTTDAGGYPTIRRFTFRPDEPAQSAPAPAYVTREEFDALAARVGELGAERGAADGK